MLNVSQSEKTEQSPENEKSFQLSPPSLSLPQGGGALKGIGEKFSANPVTGTGSMSVPIATNPGRGGFGPQLALTYDSGAGNGPFGFGWNLSLPSITRKTDKGLPRYWDAEESDVFLLSGAEDLVPVAEAGLATREVAGNTYQIQRYRPRVEGLFAQIERWTNVADSQEVFWRSLSRDNITTWYGKDADSRIADPANPSRIFSWLMCESHDDRGNVMVYRYRAENSNQVDLTQVHERNRTDESRSANRYLKSIRYGNRAPYLPVLSADASWPVPPGTGAAAASEDWFFEVVFDYGEHDQDNPQPNDAGDWTLRADPFSSYRAGLKCAPIACVGES